MKVASFDKIYVSPCYFLRKQVIEDDASFNLSLHRCPTVHNPLREQQNNKTFKPFESLIDHVSVETESKYKRERERQEIQCEHIVTLSFETLQHFNIGNNVYYLI